MDPFKNRNEAKNQDEAEPSGPFEARYLAFLETIPQLRPRLHRYCARMTGSALDGEDVVQEALFQAYRKLETFDESRPLQAWLFRIAHNRCIDFLRRRRVREGAEAEAIGPDSVMPVDPAGPAVGRAVEHLVLALPPKERACVLLKDVFDYTLEEIAELVDSTVGGVKAALSRGRAKLASLPERLAALPERKTATQKKNPETAALLHLYVERFKRRDWDGVRELIADDARLRVADKWTGRLSDSSYFGNYELWAVEWQVTAGEIDGEPVVVILNREQDGWQPKGVARLSASHGRIERVDDYLHCPWMLPAAGNLLVEPF
jgi:RNA polymerase sigma-70 factor (ECF subfamily)